MKRLWFVVAAGCGSTAPGPVLDPAAIDVLVLSNGTPVAGRDVMLIGSDGMTQHVQTSNAGDAVAMLGPAATQATVYSDAMSPDGKFTMEGVVPGDHICLFCTYTTMTCAGTPTITNLVRVADGFSWQITGAGYVGMEVSWTPHAGNPNGAGHLVSAPGTLMTSTDSSLDITIELLSRDDVTTYDELRALSKDDWAKTPFCATTAHGT